MTTNKKPKILYVASTQSHLERFHEPYIKRLSKQATVKTMATGDYVDYTIKFEKNLFSLGNVMRIRKIRKILRREQFDAVILNTTLAAFLVRAALPRGKGRPYVLNVVHGYLFGHRLRGLKSRLMLRCEKMMRKKTDDIAVMNAEDREIAKKYKLCMGEVFFMNGMGLTLSPKIPKKNRTLRTKYTRDPDDFVCLFVGELSGRKNQIFLIRAMKKLADEGMPIRLLLVGEGAERQMLEEDIRAQFLEEHVFLVGSVTPVTPYLAAADLYVSASISEGLPFNIMEAMSVGLPIVASNVKGQNDLLEQSMLYPLGDIEAFCRSVRRAYHSKNWGVGSQEYRNLDKYRIDAVFDDNMEILTAGLTKRMAQESAGEEAEK